MKQLHFVVVLWALCSGAWGSSYFLKKEQVLKKQGLHRPALFIDLERLDHNIDSLKEKLVPGIGFRIVTKSLPSVELIKYIMERAQTNKAMVFHHPFLPYLIEQLPGDTDFLFGKTVPAQGVAQLLEEYRNLIRASLYRIHWLIDNVTTFHDFLQVFKAAGLKFNANLEIDVGLHRGGAKNIKELKQMLALARSNRDIVQVTGLMGYDGHVIHNPLPGKKPVLKSLEKVIKKYREFKDVLTNYPDLKPASGWIFNGAGSATYSLYKKDAPINEASIGSAMLKGLDYDTWTLEHHLPAFYISTPVLKEIEHAELPFLGRFGAFFNRLFRKRLTGFYVYGGGWSNKVAYPAYLKPSKLMGGTPNRNIVPNQSYLIGKRPKQSTFGPGDFVFFRPLQSDTLFLFQDLHLVRGDEYLGKWEPFPSRI